MKLLALALAAALAAPALAAAQAASAPGPAASAPHMGPMGGRGGMGGMRMHGPRVGRADTPGWAMMTPAEREQHRQHMQSMHDADECRAYMNEHHAQMVERAKERGLAAPAMPRRDPCAALPAAKK